ncbi:interleukin-1 beta [Esox lucius]|uniref:Interleukin-1 n=1 Tax=Esox lucius TaxID=8010 RepID=A0A3P9AP74_ESOLU|nr:interleukin-1 beta [Esox lucius]XP_010864532.1 interleukin-1 beta [Esox lucius]
MHFDLADAISSSSSKNKEFDVKCSQPEGKAVPERELCWLHRELSLNLEYTPQCQRNMKHVAHLVIALQRMKLSSESKSTPNPFSMGRNNDPSSNILDDVLQEHVMVNVQEPVGQVKKAKGTFMRTGSLQQCKLCDENKKYLVTTKTNITHMALRAMTLRGGQSSQRVEFELSRYVNASYAVHAQPVVLGISGTNLYLSCLRPDGMTPVLHVEHFDQHLSTINSEGEELRFLFYKKTTGISNTTFESAKYPCWFISTSVDPEQPVNMCQEKDIGVCAVFQVND